MHFLFFVVLVLPMQLFMSISVLTLFVVIPYFIPTLLPCGFPSLRLRSCSFGRIHSSTCTFRSSFSSLFVLLSMLLVHKSMHVNSTHSSYVCNSLLLNRPFENTDDGRLCADLQTQNHYTNAHYRYSCSFFNVFVVVIITLDVVLRFHTLFS